jgi:hypothetical protein
MINIVKKPLNRVYVTIFRETDSLVFDILPANGCLKMPFAQLRNKKNEYLFH